MEKMTINKILVLMLLLKYVLSDHYEKSFNINKGETVIYNTTTWGFTTFDLSSIGLMDIYFDFNGLEDSCLYAIECGAYYDGNCRNELLTKNKHNQLY